MTSSPLTEPAASAPSESTRADEVRRTAARLFSESGYSATTMNDIADAVGVLPGSLYHHFSSKEEIAVDLLSLFDRALTDLGASAAERAAAADRQSEELVGQLACDVAELSLTHPAAVRLRAYEAPSVATERLRAALEFHPPAFDKAWDVTLAMFPRARLNPRVDLSLLRYAFEELTLNAPIYYPSEMKPHEVAGRLCDALLGGLVVDCPDDSALDESAAMRAALDAMAEWPPPDSGSDSSPRERIISAARHEFARRGYEATTIREIANAAGVGMAVLYRRFDSKDALVHEIIERYAGLLDKAFRAAVTAGSSAPESLDALARVFVHAIRRFSEESHIVKFGWRGREAESSPFHDYYLETQQRLRLLQELLTQGFAAGTLRSIGDPADVAVDFRSTLWLPFHKYTGISESKAHSFLRESLLRGALAKQ